MMLWYTARGAGLAALVLLSLSTCLGALVTREARTARGANPGVRFVVQYLHRTFAALGVVVLLVHVGMIVADSYAHVRLTGALIPFGSGYRPARVTLGLLAAYLFVAVAVLGLARGRMAATRTGARVWRGIHCLAYLGWLSAILHGLTSGTDTSVGWVRLTYLACGTAVVASVAVRVGALLSKRPAPSMPAAATRDRFADVATTQPLPARTGASR